MYCRVWYPGACDIISGNMAVQIPFQIVADICRKTGGRVILIGGQALGVRGYQRMTLDLDFMLTEKDYAKMKPALEGAGYREMARTQIAAKMRADAAEAMDIDFLFVAPETFHAVESEAGEENFAGNRFRVPKTEHLIALKLHAAREQPQARELRDLADIIELIKANGINAKSADFKSLSLKFGTAELYDKILRAVKAHE